MKTADLPVYRMEPPSDLDADQLNFWKQKAGNYNVIGHARHVIAALRPEWRTDEGYRRIANLFTYDLDDDPELAEQLLKDKEKLIAYAAALRLRGA